MIYLFDNNNIDNNKIMNQTFKIIIL